MRILHNEGMESGVHNKDNRYMQKRLVAMSTIGAVHTQRTIALYALHNKKSLYYVYNVMVRILRGGGVRIHSIQHYI